MICEDCLTPMSPQGCNPFGCALPSLVTLKLRKKGEEPPLWYERPSACFITGTEALRCECCGTWTYGRTPWSFISWRHGYLYGAPLCPGCDDMRRHAGLPYDGVTLPDQRWMHEAYDKLPRAVRDYPLGGSTCPTL